jgi:hypothetical protein
MRLLHELTIRGAAPQLARLLEALNQPLAGGWRRNTEAEARLTGLGIAAGRNHCFACTAEGRRPAAGLWLESRGGEGLSIDNIIPHGRRELSEDELRLILADFHSQVLQPACEGLDIRVELTTIRKTLEAYLSHDALRRLRAFSASADKSSPHPEDGQRWREFIIQAHIEGADLDSSLLEQWLAEQGWPEDQRQQLVRAYKDAQSILAAYDEERLEKCLR